MSPCPRDVCLPAILLISFGSLNRIFRRVNAPASNDKVGATLDCLAWCLVLLAELVALAYHVDACGEDDEIFILVLRELTFLGKSMCAYQADH